MENSNHLQSHPRTKFEMFCYAFNVGCMLSSISAIGIRLAVKDKPNERIK